MSFSTITIQRSLPIINGFVQVPDNLEQNKNLTVASTEVAYNINTLGESPLILGGQTGVARVAGDRYGVQELLKFPATAVTGGDDNIEALKTVVRAS
jgi:hypothetical protein